MAKYAIDLGGMTSEGEYECIGDAGAYRTRLGAWLAMRRVQGKTLRKAIRSPKISPVYGELDLDTVILGATIERFSDQFGAEYFWEYKADGSLAQKFSNF